MDKRQRVLLGVFLLIFTVFMVLMLVSVRQIDARLDGKVLINSDDHEYQRLAVNLRYGVGYTANFVLPIELYRLDYSSPLGQQFLVEYNQRGRVDFDQIWNFYRAPGWPMLLSAIYTVFGDTTLVGRSATVVLIWLVAILITVTGSVWAGWQGTLGGGIVGLIYMIPGVIRIWGLDSLMTEVPTAFWLTLFGLCFVLYEKNRRTRYFLAASVVMVALLYTRANMLTLVPLFVLYFLLSRYNWKLITAFVVITSIPVMIWSLYTSSQVGKFVTMTTQGEIGFPQFNNIQTLEGVGPERKYQGDWTPGHSIGANGELVLDWHNHPRPDENGWVKGFTFWRENITQLPRLFFYKLRAGFWTKEGIAGLYTLGIGFLLLSIGLRTPPPKPRLLSSLLNRQVFTLQITLTLIAALLMSLVGTALYGVTLILYGLILALALLRPYGDVIKLPFAAPLWFFPFVVSHLITTLLFGGVRFHEPLDPLLCLFGMTGLIVLIDYVRSPIQRRRQLRFQPASTNLS